MQAPDKSASLLNPIGECLAEPLNASPLLLQLFVPVVNRLDDVDLDVRERKRLPCLFCSQVTRGMQYLKTPHSQSKAISHFVICDHRKFPRTRQETALEKSSNALAFT